MLKTVNVFVRDMCKIQKKQEKKGKQGKDGRGFFFKCWYFYKKQVNKKKKNKIINNAVFL